MRVLFFILSFWAYTVQAQEFSIQLVIVDAIGNRDTVIYSHDPSCTDNIDTSFGEVNLYSVAWDTSLDSRFIVEYPSITQTKNLCTWTGGPFNGCYQSFGMLAVLTEHWPITIHWASPQVNGPCPVFMGLSCSDIIFQGDFSCDYSVPFTTVDFRNSTSVVFQTAIPASSPCYSIAEVPEYARFIYIDIQPSGVGIDETDTRSAMAIVSPQPASHELNISWQHEKTSAISLHDMMGKELLRQQSNGQSEVLDVSKLPNGLYMLQLVQGDVVSSQKVLVQH